MFANISCLQCDFVAKHQLFILHSSDFACHSYRKILSLPLSLMDLKNKVLSTEEQFAASASLGYITKEPFIGLLKGHLPFLVLLFSELHFSFSMDQSYFQSIFE